MDKNNTLMMAVGALAIIFIVYVLCTKSKQTFKYTSGTQLPLCSSYGAGIPGNTGPNPPYAYVEPGTMAPCSISDVCSNGALCVSNANSSTPYCSNNSNKTCDSSLDWYATCVPQQQSFPPSNLCSNCDKNGENCRPTCC